MDGEDKRDLAAAVIQHCPKIVFRSVDDDVAGLLIEAVDYLDTHEGHVEALSLDYDATGVSLTLYLHCEEPDG